MTFDQNNISIFVVDFPLSTDANIDRPIRTYFIVSSIDFQNTIWNIYIYLFVNKRINFSPCIFQSMFKWQILCGFQCLHAVGEASYHIIYICNVYNVY